MEKRFEISVNVTITFAYSGKYGEIDDEMLNRIAVELAINPNFHTIENGVRLLNVKIPK